MSRIASTGSTICRRLGVFNRTVEGEQTATTRMNFPRLENSDVTSESKNLVVGVFVLILASIPRGLFLSRHCFPANLHCQSLRSLSDACTVGKNATSRSRWRWLGVVVWGWRWWRGAGWCAFITPGLAWCRFVRLMESGKRLAREAILPGGVKF